MAGASAPRTPPTEPPELRFEGIAKTLAFDGKGAQCAWTCVYERAPIRFIGEIPDRDRLAARLDGSLRQTGTRQE